MSRVRGVDGCDRQSARLGQSVAEQLGDVAGKEHCAGGRVSALSGWAGEMVGVKRCSEAITERGINLSPSMDRRGLALGLQN